MFGVGVAFYVDVCIVFKHRLNILPYPTWGWCLGIASSLVWLLALQPPLAAPRRL